ncbi:hypothetical protein HC031_21785 [Planosporangium thailandense]|uniref:Lipoprotein n=1 Tax=Planosporangium thailandense TaxID=765197 RepID=A0ABX0Y4I6_9ACTN|nr:hypothetical protein [Planosporangium thailandense]NJC72327.1 hypothetical protein [Planosporangium thailandense]
MRLLALPAALALLLLVAGCGGAAAGSGGGAGDGYEYVDDPGDASASAPAASQSPITAREVVGHWTSSDYGDLYIQLNGAEMRVVYSHDGGRMLGSLRGSTFDGWWSEAPTRKPSDDAGEVEVTFVRAGAGLTAQGWWRPGTDTDYQQDWTMRKVDGAVPPAIRANFADATQFVRHP